MNHDNVYKLVMLALFISVAGIVLPGEDEPVVNNTNMGPSSSDMTGTGERIQDVIYWANDTPIVLMAEAHANVVGDILELNGSIDGVVVKRFSQRPITIGQNAWMSVMLVIPRGSNYSVKISNYHHYEWREYKYGKN